MVDEKSIPDAVEPDTQGSATTPPPSGVGEPPSAPSEAGAGSPAAAPTMAVPPTPPRPGVARGTGRRKTSVARVRVRAGGGAILVNERSFEDYFPSEQDRIAVLAPLKATELTESVDILARVEGGGLTGQSGAVRLGVARALREYNPALEPLLRRGGWLTRDARRKERKHYGRRGARRSFQWTKR
jgi:small subunit ribosomal protein S9